MVEPLETGDSDPASLHLPREKKYVFFVSAKWEMGSSKPLFVEYQIFFGFIAFVLQ